MGMGTGPTTAQAALTFAPAETVPAFARRVPSSATEPPQRPATRPAIGRLERRAARASAPAFARIAVPTPDSATTTNPSSVMGQATGPTTVRAVRLCAL
jgi:hypothetical protein